MWEFYIFKILQNSCLFFHPLTNCYYRFNQETNEYETFKADNEMKIPHWTKKGFKKRAKNICGLQFVQVSLYYIN